MSKPDPQPKEPWGKEHVRAMGRLGLQELRGALYPESNIAQPTEYGIFGLKTPGEVAEDRRSESLDPNAPNQPQEAPRSILHDATQRATDRAPEKTNRQRDMDMDR